MDIEEKRGCSRIEAINLLNYVYLDEEGNEILQGMGRTMNVSEKGILLETHHYVEQGQRLSLTIGLEEDMVDILGKVVYTRQERPSVYAAGIEFAEMDESAREILKRYIEVFNREHN